MAHSWQELRKLECHFSLSLFFLHPYPHPLRNPYFLLSYKHHSDRLWQKLATQENLRCSKTSLRYRVDCVKAAGASGSQPGRGDMRASFMLMNDWGW